MNALQFATMVILTVLRGRRVVKASSSMLPRSVPPLAVIIIKMMLVITIMTMVVE